MPTYKIMVENLDTRVGELLSVYGSGPRAARKNVITMAKMKWKTDNVRIVENWRDHARKADKKPKLSLTTQHKKLWLVYSIFIRVRDTHLEDDGIRYGNCISCQKRVAFTEGDAGHFIKATYLMYRYDERNVHLQCRYCNRFLDGNQAEYMRAMERLYGREAVDHMLDTKHETRQYKAWELQELREAYKLKIIEMEELGQDYFAPVA